MALSLAIGVLTGGGLYLILQRELVRIVFGFMLISHAANLLLMSSGVITFRLSPVLGTADPEQMADPLPQAFVLTSIVITLATAIYMLTLAIAGQRSTPPFHADRTDLADLGDREAEQLVADERSEDGSDDGPEHSAGVDDTGSGSDSGSASGDTGSAPAGRDS